LDELVDIVSEAKKAGKGIRCAAAGHSWSSMSVTDGYMVKVDKLEKVLGVSQLPDGQWIVEIESGVYVNDLDKYLNEHSPPLAFASSSIIDTVRYGGLVAMGCHGAKTDASTISDNVFSMKIVTADQGVVEFSDEINPAEMAAARVNLGLFGIIYSMKLKVEPQFHFRYINSIKLNSDLMDHPEKLKDLVLNHDSVELLYFPFNSDELTPAGDKILIKTWDRTTDPLTESELGGDVKDFFQNLGLKYGDTLYKFIVKVPSSTPFMSSLLFKTFKESNQVLRADRGIHYQKGIDYVNCLDMCLPFKCDDDFSNVCEAWNSTIEKMYERAKDNSFPLNLVIETRFIRASSSILSPVYDKDPNAIYTMLEILSLPNTGDWNRFYKEIGTDWMKKYNARTHWAKIWEDIPNIIPHLQTQLGDNLTEFEKLRSHYDAGGVFFGNKSLRKLFNADTGGGFFGSKPLRRLFNAI